MGELTIDKKETEMKYFNLINDILDIVLELNLDNTFTYISPQVYNVLGYSPEELIGKRFLGLIHPDDISKVLKGLKKTLKNGIIIAEQFRIQHKDGHYIPVSARGHKVEYDNQIKFVVTFRDISKEKEAEQTLKETENFLSNILKRIQDGIYVLDKDFNIISINPRIEEWFSQSKPIIGKKCFQAFRNKTEICEDCKCMDILETGESFCESELYKESNGKIEKIFNVFTFPYYDHETGNFNGFIKHMHDVTDQKKAKQKLKESKEKFRGFLDFGNIGMAITSIDKEWIYYNDQICEIFGFTREELLEKTWTDLSYPEDLQCDVEQFKRILEGEIDSYQIEKRYIKKNGEIVFAHLTVSCVRNSDGTVKHFLATLQDITERKIAEQNLKISEENYREAYNRAELYKDLFYHDINNILSNIKFSIDLSEIYLKDSEKENNITDLYNVIRQQFVRGTKLINNIQNLSQIKNSQIKLKPIDAIKILEEAKNFIVNDLKTKNIDIVINSCDNEVFIFADEFLLDIFDNLLINSIKYNQNSKKEVVVNISKVLNEGMNCIKFELIDNGIGITDEKKKILFQENFSKTKGSKGLGIGLTLVKKIVDSYNGKIWVEDRIPGDFSKGSNFCCLIPEVN